MANSYSHAFKHRGMNLYLGKKPHTAFEQVWKTSLLIDGRKNEIASVYDDASS